MKKTLKRETAGAMLVFLFGLFLYSALTANPVALDAAKFLTLPIFSFASLAFGLDAYAKQVGQG